MEHAHANAASHDHILASFLEQGTLPEVARRVNMSLASLAAWATKHADLLASLHQLITTRCKLLVAQLECAALSSLAAVSTAPTRTDDTKLRERALERQRKAACAILRHRAFLERAPRAPRAGTHQPPPAHAQSSSSLDTATLPPPHVTLDEVPQRNRRTAVEASPLAPKLSLADRFAARRLAALATERA